MATYEEDFLAMATAILGAEGVAGLTFNEAMKAMAAQVIVNGFGGGGIPGLIPRVAGDYLHPPLRGGGNGSVASAAAGAVFATPIVVPAAFTVDAVAIRVTTSEAACLAGAYLYAADADGHPVSQVLAAEGIDCSATGARVGTLGAGVTLDPGLYWAFVRSNSPGGLVRFYCVSPGTGFGSVSAGLVSAGGTPWGLTADIGLYGATAATLSAWGYSDPGGNTVQPLAMLRRA